MEDINCWASEFEPCHYSQKLLNKILELNKEDKIQIDINQLKKAIYYIKKYHGSQMRQSGEPYYSHPIEVALIVADYLVSEEAIIAALLHDTVEDTKISLNQIKFIFGATIAKLVDTVTKVTSNYQLSKEETLHKLNGLTDQDRTAITIKIFDRLHNMRSLKYFKSIQKQKRIALETLQVYIPLAKYLNIPEIEAELNAAALAVLNI